MPYAYFTKTLQSLDLAGLIDFLDRTGLDGLDMAVRPGFPIDPTNAPARLPEAAKQLADHGKKIALISMPTGLSRASDGDSVRVFEAARAAGVSFVKLGYFRYQGNFEKDLSAARRELEGFAKLAEQTGVRACYHTHSGGYIGSNGESQRELLAGFDPHWVGCYLDTGHQSVGGAPFRLAADAAGAWLSLIAIKDMVWEKTNRGWSHRVAPAGAGIVDWAAVAGALKARSYQGWISLHGEYEASDLDERIELARRERAFLGERLGD